MAACLSFLFHFYICDRKNAQKTCLTQKQMIMTSERRVEHPFAGQNTQQLLK